jgi:hypothetical protein
MPDTFTRNTRDGRRLADLLRVALARNANDRSTGATRRRSNLKNLLKRIEHVLERDEQTQQEKPV